MNSRRLKELREKAGLTQAAMAKAVGMKQPTYARLESGSRYEEGGKRIDPRLSTLERLCAVLKCSVAELVTVKRKAK